MRNYLILFITLFVACQPTPIEQTAVEVTRPAAPILSTATRIIITDSEPTPTLRPSPTPLSATIPTTASETAVPMPTTTLPAPLYYSQEQQIMRLEPDGTTNTLLHTAEMTIQLLIPSTVDNALYYQTDQKIIRLELGSLSTTIIVEVTQKIRTFDLSPIDDSLVYVSDNALIVTDRFGHNGLTLIEGKPRPEGDDLVFGPSPWRLEDEIYSVRWSPTGRQIAFGMGGVNIIAKAGSQLQTVWANTSATFDEAGVVKEAGAFVFPDAWSPNGNYLLLSKVFVAAHAEGYKTAVAHIPSNTLTPLSLASPTFYSGLWTDDSSTLYLHADYNFFSGAPSALEQYMPATNQLTQLIVNANNDWENRAAYHWLRAPFLAENGRLRLFLSNDAEFTFPTTFTPYQFPDNFSTIADLTPLHPESLPIENAWWSLDGSGALLYLGIHDTTNTSPWYWLPLSTGAQPVPINLPDQGLQHLIWGQ